jgi:ABC-type branched-subunit amino acid transport system substrate-binding protein
LTSFNAKNRKNYFGEKRKSYIGIDTYQSTINYDALLVLRELILQVDEPTPQKLKEALLRQSQFQGIHSE